MKVVASNSELRTIPGVGVSIAADLEDLKIRKISDLRGRDPETMYEALCSKRGHQDRCLLYVFRCAVYFAQTRRPDPEKLKWWNWSDNYGAESSPNPKWVEVSDAGEAAFRKDAEANACACS